VRRALSYVLLDARKQWKERCGRAPEPRLDLVSSGRWFDGWRRAPPRSESEDDAPGRPEVAPARTWLLAVGWRRHGLVDPAEVPGS
jgi:hypothetical protein